MLSDTTVITTRQGKLYVAGILDLYGDCLLYTSECEKSGAHKALSFFYRKIVRSARERFAETGKSISKKAFDKTIEI